MDLSRDFCIFFLGFLSSWHHPDVDSPLWDDHGMALRWLWPEARHTGDQKHRGPLVTASGRPWAGLKTGAGRGAFNTCVGVVSPIGLPVIFLGLDWSLGKSIHVRYSQIFSSNVSLTRLKSKVVFIVATMRWHGIMIPVSSRSFRDQHCRGWWQSRGDHRSWGISFALLASICLHVPCLDPTSQTFQQFQEAQLVGDSMGLHNTIYWDAIYIWQYYAILMLFTFQQFPVFFGAWASATGESLHGLLRQSPTAVFHSDHRRSCAPSWKICALEIDLDQVNCHEILCWLIRKSKLTNWYKLTIIFVDQDWIESAIWYPVLEHDWFHPMVTELETKPMHCLPVEVVFVLICLILAHPH